MRKSTKIKFWILIVIAILLTCIYLFGQTMAFINYEFTVAMGLQEPADEITEVGVAFNKGFGFGDTIVYIPFLLVGIIGMIKRNIGVYSQCPALWQLLYIGRWLAYQLCYLQKVLRALILQIIFPTQYCFQ